MAKFVSGIGGTKVKTRPRKRPGRHAKTVAKREKRQTFFGQGACRG